MRSSLAQRALLVALLALPLAAFAQVYKWVDNNGVINYGDRPPKDGTIALPLDERALNFSVVPGLSRAEIDRMWERSDNLRLQRLERENDLLRAELRLRESRAYAQRFDDEVFVPIRGFALAQQRRR